MVDSNHRIHHQELGVNQQNQEMEQKYVGHLAGHLARGVHPSHKISDWNHLNIT